MYYPKWDTNFKKHLYFKTESQSKRTNGFFNCIGEFQKSTSHSVVFMII